MGGALAFDAAWLFAGLLVLVLLAAAFIASRRTGILRNTHRAELTLMILLQVHSRGIAANRSDTGKIALCG